MRLTALAGALALAMATSGAFAQAPPAPSDNPNDTVADQANAPAYGEPINAENAKKAAAAALDEAKKRNWNVFCVVIVNPAGELVYFEKQDNCQNASITI